ncbi:MAG: hypothetical protein ACK500_10845 [Flavobacteriales bacterium]
MKKVVVATLMLAVFSLVLYQCKPTPQEALKEDPVAYYGHGSFVGHDGKNLVLSAEYIEQMQLYYIRQFETGAIPSRTQAVWNKEEASKIRKTISDVVEDNVLANALFLDWADEKHQPDDGGRHSMLNNGLRWYYLLNFVKNPILPDKKGGWWKGLTEDQAERLRESGIIVYAITNSSMNDYCEECLDQGVPVPEKMFGPEWQNMGSFDGDEFISTLENPELLLKISTDPPGYCLALPRYDESDSAQLLGVICMSYVTSKVCFFDNPRGVFHKKNIEIDFRTNFVGGFDLEDNGQGTCTDCHAGENPFVTHPEVPAFMNYMNAVGYRTMPPRWHIPLVHGTWPLNPGPTNILDAVSSPGQCNSCHSAGGSGGRFPRVSYPLEGYCGNVLRPAVRTGGTMPMGGQAGLSNYANHIAALLSSCDNPKGEGEVTGPTTPPLNSPSVISPPIVIDPVYACATVIGIRGAVLGAKVELYKNGVLIGTIDSANSPHHIEFTGLDEFEPEQEFYATQTIDGATSDKSNVVKVRKVEQDYPDGLPAPAIDPATVYECASVIAVRHIPGAVFTVYTNGSNPRSTNGGSTGYTVGRPSGGPFVMPMEFTVEQSICGVTSPRSSVVRTSSAPASLPAAQLEPATVYVNQELLQISGLTYGAKTVVREMASATSGSFQTPISWYPDYHIAQQVGRPLRPGDQVQVVQELCGRFSPWEQPNSKLHDCERLPGCRIETPRAGTNYVLPYDIIPGSRVRVYDESGNEIGDGSGTVVTLTRNLVSGERLIITQSLGECTSAFVFSILVTS